MLQHAAGNACNQVEAILTDPRPTPPIHSLSLAEGGQIQVRKRTGLCVSVGGRLECETTHTHTHARVKNVQGHIIYGLHTQVTTTEAGIQEIARTVSSCRVVALDCEAFVHPVNGSQVLSLIQLCTGSAFFVIDMLVRLLLAVCSSDLMLLSRFALLGLAWL